MTHLLDILVRPPGFGFFISKSTRLQKALLDELDALRVGAFRVESGDDGTYAWLGTNERALYETITRLAFEQRPSGVRIEPTILPHGSIGPRFRVLIRDTPEAA